MESSKNNNKLFRAVVLSLVVMSIAPMTIRAEILSQAVKDSLSTNPDVMAAQAQLRVNEAEYSASKGGYYPSLDILYAKGSETTSSPSTRLVSSSDITLDRQEAGLVLRQPLFDPLKYNEIQRAKAVKNASGLASQATEEKLLYETIRSFATVHSNKRVVDVAKSSLATHENILAKVTQKAVSGAGTQTDMRQAEGRVAMARVNYLQFQSALENSEYEYQTIVGHLPQGEMVDDLNLRLTDIDNRNAAVTEAIKVHPLISKLQYEVEAAREELDGARSRFYPTVSVEARKNSNENLNGIEGAYDDHSVMLRLQYNLVNGGADWMRSRGRAEKVNEALYRLELGRRQVTEAVNKAWTNREIAKERLAYLVTQQEKTEAVREGYLLQFELGKRSLLDVLDIEKELLNARKDRIKAEAELATAEASLLYAMGRLKPALFLARK